MEVYLIWIWLAMKRDIVIGKHFRRPVKQKPVYKSNNTLTGFSADVD